MATEHLFQSRAKIYVVFNINIHSNSTNRALALCVDIISNAMPNILTHYLLSEGKLIYKSVSCFCIFLFIFFIIFASTYKAKREICLIFKILFMLSIFLFCIITQLGLLKQVFLKMPCQSRGQSTHNALPPTVLLAVLFAHLRSWHWRRCPHRSRSYWPPWQLPLHSEYHDCNMRDEMLDTEYAEMCTEFLDVLSWQLHTEHVYFMTGS